MSGLTKLRRDRESTVQDYLIEQVRLAGGKACKIEGEAGTPDTLVKLPCRPACLVEVKRPGEAPEGHQVERAREWMAAGLHCGWVESKFQVDKFVKTNVLKAF